uniref:Uncharacterized protein n=1 Tax=Auxenochlorella protothecoides TaxID=3075 RepID=A0A1D1ZR03_AUXPR
MQTGPLSVSVTTPPPEKVRLGPDLVAGRGPDQRGLCRDDGRGIHPRRPGRPAGQAARLPHLGPAPGRSGPGQRLFPKLLGAAGPALRRGLCAGRHAHRCHPVCRVPAQPRARRLAPGAAGLVDAGHGGHGLHRLAHRVHARPGLAMDAGPGLRAALPPARALPGAAGVAALAGQPGGGGRGACRPPPRRSDQRPCRRRLGAAANAGRRRGGRGGGDRVVARDARRHPAPDARQGGAGGVGAGRSAGAGGGLAARAVLARVPAHHAAAGRHLVHQRHHVLWAGAAQHGAADGTQGGAVHARWAAQPRGPRLFEHRDHQRCRGPGPAGHRLPGGWPRQEVEPAGRPPAHRPVHPPPAGGGAGGWGPALHALPVTGGDHGGLLSAVHLHPGDLPDKAAILWASPLQRHEPGGRLCGALRHRVPGGVGAPDRRAVPAGGHVPPGLRRRLLPGARDAGARPAGRAPLRTGGRG